MTPERISIIVCSRAGRRRQSCATPGCRGAGLYLCDFPVGKLKDRTCDRAMCADCRRPQRNGVDYCRVHAEQKGAP